MHVAERVVADEDAAMRVDAERRGGGEKRLRVGLAAAAAVLGRKDDRVDLCGETERGDLGALYRRPAVGDNADAPIGTQAGEHAARRSRQAQRRRVFANHVDECGDRRLGPALGGAEFLQRAAAPSRRERGREGFGLVAYQRGRFASRLLRQQFSIRHRPMRFDERKPAVIGHIAEAVAEAAGEALRIAGIRTVEIGERHGIARRIVRAAKSAGYDRQFSHSPPSPSRRRRR